MLIEKLNGMESAAVDVEVDIPSVEIRGAGFPHFYLRMHRFYRFPDGLADTFTLNTHLHIEESQLAYNTISCNDGTAHTLAILADGFIGFGTFCLIIVFVICHKSMLECLLHFFLESDGMLLRESDKIN